MNFFVKIGLHFKSVPGEFISAAAFEVNIGDFIALPIFSLSPDTIFCSCANAVIPINTVMAEKISLNFILEELKIIFM